MSTDAVSCNGLKRFVISGAGPVGLLTAIGLADRGFAVDVYEGRAAIEQRIEESYPIGVNLRGLGALGYVDPALREAVEQTGRLIDSWDIHGGERRVAQVESGACYSHSRFGVTKVLFDAATSAKYAGKIAVHMSKKVKELTLSKDPAAPSTLLFEDGTSVSVGPAAATGLIAADGVSSMVRRALVKQTAEGVEQSERVEEALVPWNIKFRVLLCDRTPQAQPGEEGKRGILDPKVHYIYNGAYCAVTGVSNQWTAVASCKFGPKPDPEAAWFESCEASDANIASLKEYIKSKVPPMAKVEEHFSEDELKAFFTRRIFTGSLVKASRLDYGGWCLLMGDAAHAMFPATGEGINSGMEDSEFLLRCIDAKLDKALIPQEMNPKDAANPLRVYSIARQPDVEGMHNLAKEILAMSTGTPKQRASILTTSILYGIGRKLGLGGPNEAELRYGPPSKERIMPYREVFATHHKQTKWARRASKLVAFFFSDSTQ